MYKIKIALLKDNYEIDFIDREMPTWNKYDVIKGLLIDLYLVIRRNFSTENDFEWLIYQSEKYTSLD